LQELQASLEGSRKPLDDAVFAHKLLQAGRRQVMCVFLERTVICKRSAAAPLSAWSLHQQRGNAELCGVWRQVKLQNQ
jgi:hypothetical protein